MAHLISLWICLFMPVLGWLNDKKLKTSKDRFAKVKTYVLILVIYWSTFALIALITPLQKLIFPLHGVYLPIWINTLGWLLFAYMVASAVIPMLVWKHNEEVRHAAAESYREHVYPTTRRQRTMFAAVAVTVGICEEVMFRGFLFQYFQQAPFNLQAVWSFLLALLIFGAGHFVQGARGVIESTMFGLLMFWLYAVTGSLLVPIILHILYDLKVNFLSRKLYP